MKLGRIDIPGLWMRRIRMPLIRIRPLLRPLDRYVLSEFWRIFATTLLGFPLLVIVIDLTDQLDKYLARQLPPGQIALSYLYWIPDSMFMVLPAAVLFATVFTIGGFTRHSEITAAKASGISFRRMAAPIFGAAALVSVFGLVLGELVPITNARRLELLQERRFRGSNTRFNFAYAAERGRVYKVSTLNVALATIDHLEVERKGSGPEYPSYIITARNASWDSTAGWRMDNGTLHVLPDSLTDIAVAYDSLRDKKFVERPSDLVASPRSPEEMRYEELGRFIAALERSGGNAKKLKVEQALKIAIPITCIIIAFFGAPLATSTQRGGTAMGIGMSLATTVLFLLMVQITKAVGAGGVLPPTLAAWIPNVIFSIMAAVLMVRVRT